MKARFFLIVALVSSFLGPAWAQEADLLLQLDLTRPERPGGVRELDLDAFVELGLSQNPIMQTAAQQVEEARARYEQLKTQKNPQLVLNDTTAAQPETSIDTGSLLPNSFQSSANFPDKFVLVSPLTNQLQLSLRVLLTTFGKVENTIAAAFLNIDSASASADVDKQNLKYSIKEAFFLKLKADAHVAVSRENLAVAKKNLSDTQALFEQGVMSRYDLLQAEIQVTEAIEGLAENLTNVDIAAANITNVLAERQFYAQPVTPPDVQVASGIKLPVLEEFALQHRAEMRALEFSKASAQKLVDAAYGENQPTLSLAANYRTAFGQSLSPVNQPSLTLQLEWAIFDGGFRKAKVKEAKATLEQIVATQQSLENNIVLQVDQYWADLNQSAFSVRTAEQQVSNAAEYQYMARERFINGLATSLELSDALRNLVRARTELVDAKNNRDIAFARLEQALGKDIPERDLTPEFLTSFQDEETPEK